MLQLLVSLGGDIHRPASEYSDLGIVEYGCDEGALQCVQWLLTQNVRLSDQRDGETRSLALAGAAREGHLEIVKLLVEQGAPINAV